MARYFDAQQTSAVGVTVAKPVEIKVPLWWADGTNASDTATMGLVDGGGLATLTSTSEQTLHTLSSKWPAGTKFAFEATIWSSSSTVTATATLEDRTNVSTGQGVGGSPVSTTATTATVIRSGQFTLTAGHTLGVALQPSSGGTAIYISDASLIIFP